MVEISASLTEGLSHRVVVLASQVESWQKLLTAAGLAFHIILPDVDEAAIHEALYNGNAETDPSDVAELLARAKAEEVSARVPAALVLGADQVLSLDGKILDKPVGRDAVRDRLLALRGKTHQLHSAVALAKEGQVVWSHIETAHLTMRAFSPEFLSRYLAAAGPQVCQSVGPYQLDGLGIQLFDRIEGDYFAILGLPVLLLFERLRESQVLGV
jgi:nucleoside triphosphate pyrophosphatase